MASKTNGSIIDATTSDRKTICVYCGSSSGVNPVFTEAAESLGSLLHDIHWRLVYGGGTSGLMGSIARAAMGPELDGEVHGVIPDALVSKERRSTIEGEDDEVEIVRSIDQHRGTASISPKFGRTTIVKDMHSRKRLMASESDAFVALPGGYGTVEEIMECITWSQLGIHSKPIVLFNVNGFFDPLLEFIQNAILNGFVSAANGVIVQVANTAQEVVDKIREYVVPAGRFALNWTDEGNKP